MALLVQPQYNLTDVNDLTVVIGVVIFLLITLIFIVVIVGVAFAKPRPQPHPQPQPQPEPEPEPQPQPIPDEPIPQPGPIPDEPNPDQPIPDQPVMSELMKYYENYSAPARGYQKNRSRQDSRLSPMSSMSSMSQRKDYKKKGYDPLAYSGTYIDKAFKYVDDFRKKHWHDGHFYL